jgi:hypothetical protein
MAWHTINSEHSTCSQEQEEESSQTFCLDTYLSGLAKSRNIHEKSCCKGSGTESCQSSPFGTTSERLTGDRGEGLSMLSQVDSHALTSQTETKAKTEKQDLMDVVVRCGLKRGALLARYDQENASWKMSQGLLNLGFQQSYPTFTQSGIMQDGVCYRAEIAKGYINVKDYGFTLFTPTATDYKRRNLSTPMFKRRMATRNSPGTLPEQLAWMGFTGILNPTLPEVMMRWPTGWTDFRPLGMDKMQEWLRSHGAYSQTPNQDTAKKPVDKQSQKEQSAKRDSA